jgi:hypothetical protein
VAAKSKRRDITLRHCASRGVGSESEVVQVLRGRTPANGRGAAHSRVGPGAGASRDGGDTPWSLTSRSTTSEPDEESWDFDGNMITSARNRTRRRPMLTHETSPVLGASVVGMTSGVCQGQRCLPAGVLGISTVLSQEDRLHPKGRLRQQPTGDSTAESQSWRRRQDPSNGCFAESSLAPTR